jgi:hypothetical protein
MRASGIATRQVGTPLVSEAFFPGGTNIAVPETPRLPMRQKGGAPCRLRMVML